MRAKGAGILEVVIAMAILIIALTALIPSFIYYLRTNTSSEVRTQAIIVAQQVLEELRLKDPASLPTQGQQTITRNQGGRSFTVVVNYCQDPSLCSGNARHLVLEVKQGGKRVYEVETVYTSLR